MIIKRGQRCFWGDMQLDVRTYNGLINAGYHPATHSVQDLRKITREDFLKISNVGRKSYNHLQDCLFKYIGEPEIQHEVEKKESMPEAENINCTITEQLGRIERQKREICLLKCEVLDLKYQVEHHKKVNIQLQSNIMKLQGELFANYSKKCEEANSVLTEGLKSLEYIIKALHK